ncbi:Hypothetical protein, putative [Bodo saltans]|uniref:Uncharacterized protein n=1 Tax=Bodo saltans TaxID=75058 RepID=A0A0S4J608_BODSA|nr:Hypothetical protein, putative [Bodo saltans]|eukprot:CUG62326.1 Hypothetical protein, putative [Bodo saltans]
MSKHVERLSKEWTHGIVKHGMTPTIAHPSQESYDSGHEPHSEADATRSLLEIDDEYTSPFSQRSAPSGFRHYYRDTEVGERRRNSRRQADAAASTTQASPTSHDSGTTRGVDDGGDAPKSDDDDTGWRVDYEEEETRGRLEKAMRDQQRLRMEELYELQKVYTKAVRKNFRSLRGMPEPSFDTPSALYEEELDAIEEHRLSVAAGDEVIGLSTEFPPPPSMNAHALQSPRSLESLGFLRAVPHQSGEEGALAADLVEPVNSSHHADCVDERSIVVASADAIHRAHSTGAGTFTLGGGTHIHTTHGGGTTGDGGVLVGSSNFVSRLRRRTTTDPGERFGSFPAEMQVHDDE